MNLGDLIICTLLLNFLAVNLFAQEETPKPFLVEKFRRQNCEYVLMQMDNFMAQLQSDPNAAGYAIVYGSPRATATAEREIKNWVRIRNFDSSRINLVRGGGSDRIAEIEFWLVPPGAELPMPSQSTEPAEPESPAETVDTTKPYIFSYEFVDGIDGCKPAIDLELYAAALKENPNSRGNIVIYEASQTAFRQKEKEILSELIKNGVARKRLKTFYVKVKLNTLAEGIELWVLPQK